MFENLGSKLKALRMKNQLSRKQVAELIGISVSMVGFYENNERLPSLPILVKLASLYKVSVDYLLDITTGSKETLSLEGLSKEQIKAIQSLIECFHNAK